MNFDDRTVAAKAAARQLPTDDSRRVRALWLLSRATGAARTASRDLEAAEALLHKPKGDDGRLRLRQTVSPA